MADGSSKFKNSINLAPQSSDPSNPAEGDVFRADGTSRAEGLWEYKDGAWTQIGSGAGGGTTINLGATVTAWQSFTPTGTWSTNTTYFGQYRRVGDTAEIEITLELSGAPDTATLEVDLPSGLTIDTTKIDARLQHSSFGLVSIGDNGGNTYFGSVQYVDTNTVRPMNNRSEGSGNESTLRITTQAQPITFASGDRIFMRFSVPISGWSVADLPTSTDGVIVEAVGSGSTQSIANDTPVKVTNWTTEQDTSSAFSSGTFTVPETGNYSISASLRFNTDGGNDVTRALAVIYVNGSQVRGSEVGENTASASRLAPTISISSLRLTQGDTVEIYAYQANTSTNANNLDGSSVYQFLSIHKIGFNTIIDNQGIEKNYFKGNNSSLEESIGDWVAYADAAGTEPVDGVDGSPTITATRNTTTALRGTGDLLFTKDAANRQGEGISCPFTIDIADRAKKLTISFDYSTSANYADGDVKIFIYDLTNSNLIRVNGEDLKAVSGQSTHYAQFQTAPDSTNYRLIIHQSTTDATAYTINLDNIRVGPTSLAKGAIITDWEDFDLTIGLSSYQVNIAKKRRVGSNVEILAEIQLTAGFGGNTNLTLPEVLDNSKLSGVAGRTTIDSEVDFYDSSANQAYRANAMFSSTTIARLDYRRESSPYILNSGVTSTTPFTWASGDKIFIKMRYPVVGWSSEAVMSEDLGGREIRVEAFRATSNLTVTTSELDIVFNSEIEDTSNSYDPSTGIFTVPEAGVYDVKPTFRVDTGGSVPSQFVFNVRHLDSVGASIQAYTVNANSDIAANKAYVFSTSVSIRASKGDQIKLTGQSVTNSSTLLAGGSYLFITKDASPQTILETETVAARYYTTSGQSMDNTVAETVVWDTVVTDTHNAMNTSTGVYTVPVTGFYQINGKVTFANLDTLSGEFTIVRLKVNGSFVDDNYDEYESTNTLVQKVDISTAIELTKGDTVELAVYQQSGAGEALDTGASQNTFSIHRIK